MQANLEVQLLICKKEKTIIIVDVKILINHKTINSKSQSNNLNFDANMKDFLSKLPTKVSIEE